MSVVTYDNSLNFLTKHGITEEEARAILQKEMKSAKQHYEYQATLRAQERAMNLAYERKTVLEKMMYRWERLVRQYGGQK